MDIFNDIKGIFSGDNSKNVRIEKIKPIDTAYEIDTDTILFENHNIEECIKATERLKISHIHLQTNTIEFLADPRLQNIKGIRIQFEIANIEPLFNLRHLTHLSLPDNIEIEFDFSRFKNLIFLGGRMPKKYINLDQLSNLKYTYLFGFGKPDFKDFSHCTELRNLWMYAVDVETMEGLSELTYLTQIDLENCRKLTSLEGIGMRNVNLQTIHLNNCKKLKDAGALVNLPDLRELRLYQVLELNSLNFLNALGSLENLMLHPSKVGVKNKDYYPLVEVLRNLDKLDNLKGWKPLKEYLNKKVIVEPIEQARKSDWELISVCL